MEQILYFGKVKYIIHSDFEVHLKEWEKQFQNKIIDIYNVIQVNIKSIESMDNPSGQLIKNDPNFEIWNECGKEVRYYLERVHRRYYAKGIKDGNNLEILYDLSSEMKENYNFSVINLLQLETFLLENDGMVLHSSFIKYKKDAILFSAPSGTGKTTQANLWKKNYDNISIINGDKSLLQFYNNHWYAMGFPIHGSSDECYNEIVPIRCIVIVRQAKSDEILQLNDVNKIKLLFSEITTNIWNAEAIDKTLEKITQLVKDVEVIQLNCTMNDNAAHVLHNYLYGED